MHRPYMNSESWNDETKENYKGYYDQSIHGLSQKEDTTTEAKAAEKTETKEQKATRITEELKDEPPKDLVSGSFNRINGAHGEAISDGQPYTGQNTFFEKGLHAHEFRPD